MKRLAKLFGKGGEELEAAERLTASPQEMLAAEPRSVLEDMQAAGVAVRRWQEVLARTGDNVVGEVLRHGGTFYEWNHYPEGDVYDRESHAQYYYHAHPQNLRGGEHGHFHTFLRGNGMPENIRPAPVADLEAPKDRNDLICHLIAISMDRAGVPIRLFTTNRWVTGETWYAAEDAIALLDRFNVAHARPSYPANQWIGEMLRLFRPQIRALLLARDRAVAGWQKAHPGVNVYEDRDLEVTSACEISVDAQMAAIEKRLAG